MHLTYLRWSGNLSLLSLVLFVAGCGGGNDTASSQSSGGSDTNVPAVAQTDDHSDWWCAEHGVPEAECARCDSSLIASFKEKGDWCAEHDRPKSQCFKCDPSRVEKFAARYEAKFGKQPPKPTE